MRIACESHVQLYAHKRQTRPKAILNVLSVSPVSTPQRLCRKGAGARGRVRSDPTLYILRTIRDAVISDGLHQRRRAIWRRGGRCVLGRLQQSCRQRRRRRWHASRRRDVLRCVLPRRRCCRRRRWGWSKDPLELIHIDRPSVFRIEALEDTSQRDVPCAMDPHRVVVGVTLLLRRQRER